MLDLAGRLARGGGIISDKFFSPKNAGFSLALFSAALMLVFPLFHCHVRMGMGMFTMGFLVFIPD
jgi:hypothetical protein